MAEALVNGGSSTLNGAITNVATTVVIQTGDIGKFPATGTYRVSVTDNTNTEIMTVTGGQGTASLTVTRHSEAYAGASTGFAFASGSAVAQVLTVGGLTAFMPAGGALTYQQTTLVSDVGFSTGAWTTVFSLTLAAGTWLINVTVSAQLNGANATADMRLYDGTTVLASTEISTTNGFRAEFALSKIVVLGGSTTISAQAQSYVGACTATAATLSGTVASACNMSALKIA